MGVSTDGILAYGLAFDDEGPDFEALCEHLGGDAEGLSGYDVEDLADELLESKGLGLLRHCSGEYPMFIITLRNSYVRATRGNAERIRELPAPTPSQEQYLKDLQAGLGGELGVWLCSYWG